MSVPVLRFKDDDGRDFPEWKNGTLGDAFEYRNGKSFENEVSEDGEYFLVTLNSINIAGKLKHDHKRVAKSDSSLIANDLVMILSDVAHGNFLGLTDVIPSDKYVLNQRIGGLRAKINLNVRFASLYINYNQKYFKLHGQGSSQLNLSKGDVLDFNLPQPHIKEQTKIANFLTAVDEKITQLTQKHDLLTQYKKGVMQQIFSQELRFKDGNGQDFPEWEEAAFDELFYVANNKKTQIKSSDYLEQGNTPIVDQGQKHIVGYTNNTEIYKDLPVIIFGDHTRILKWIDFVFASGADGTQVLKSTDKINLKFGYYALCHIELPNLGYSRHMKELKNQFIIIPTSIVEQTKIANFLTVLDDKITATQTQLKAVKQYKQGLLQQMFV